MSASIDAGARTDLQESGLAAPQDEAVSQLLSAVSDLSQSLRALQSAVSTTIDRRSNILPFRRPQPSHD